MAKSEVLVRMKADTQGYDANIAKARRQLDQFKKDNLSMGGMLKQVNSSLLATATHFASVTAAVGALGSAIRSNIETARGFEKSMSQLSSLTGMVGKDLDTLKEYAIELGASTTLSASEVANAFKMIGSQQPQLLASGEALKEVTKYAITLSEAAGIELATAAQTLSTSINQMGGDSNNAARYINVLAAASQKGAGDIAWLGEAITKSATAAKAVGTDYEELVANLEQLAKAGFDASTAGTALRSIIMNLEKQANNEFKPSVVGLTQAFENLGKANLTISDYQKLTGKMFATQAMALADAAKEARNMTEAITGTNIAEEQARINTANLDGALKSLSSAWEGLNLHINGSNGPLTAFINALTQTIRKADTMIVILKTLKKYWGGGITPETGGEGGGGTTSGDTITEIPEITVTGNLPKPKKPKATKSQKTEYQLNTEAIDKLSQEYVKASKERQAAIRDEIKVLQERNRVIQQMIDEAQGKTGKLTTPVPFGIMGPMMDVETKMTSVKGTGLSQENPLEKFKNIAIELKSPLQALEEELKKIQELQAAAWSPEVFAAYQKQINELQGKINTFKGIKKDADSSTRSFQTAAAAISQVGSAMQSIEDPTTKVMGIVAQAIANIALGFSQASTAESGKGVLAWIAAIAGGMATMVSTIEQIHSATGYAQGGIIKGNSYSGDNIGGVVDGGKFVGLNAGEVVLNASQQSTLAGNLQGAGDGDIKIVGVLDGENIVLVADRWGRRVGKGELLFGKNL